MLFSKIQNFCVTQKGNTLVINLDFLVIRKYFCGNDGFFKLTEIDFVQAPSL